jgi:iron complex transport system ATP-binding protein
VVMISLHDLHIHLQKTPIIDGVDAHMSSDEMVGIIGPNGAGKSTLMRAIAGLLPYHGDIRIDDVPLSQMSTSQRAKAIAYLPQGQTLHWPLSVERLVGLGRLPHLGPLSQMSPADQSIIDRAMERADVTGFADRDATELSGGERARVLLARALAVEAPILLVDEPLANLDPGHQIDVMHVLKNEASCGNLVLAVLHDLPLAARYCDRLLLLKDGQLIADGTPQEVLTRDHLRQAYGVTATVDFSGELPHIQVLSRAS